MKLLRSFFVGEQRCFIVLYMRRTLERFVRY